MNERIKELAKQAGRTGLPYGEIEIQKFAELIVRECARVVDEKLDFENAYGPDDWAEGADLLNHFGVEE
jgi:hypothetical protein